MEGIQEAIKKYQQQLLDKARNFHVQNPLSPAAEKAFLETPRHAFVSRYREWGTRQWHEINADNLQEHLAMLYESHPLILFGDDDEDIISTISEPVFVLRLLEMLQLKPGHNVFELGTGSGWNAALMGNIVGPQGHVYSTEIVPELAKQAQVAIRNLGIDTVTVIEADGGDGYAPGAPYDRAMFTAGTYDLPRHFYQQIKQDGLLLVVIKNEGGGDTLFLLKKERDHFVAIESLDCMFVQMTGKYRIDNLMPVDLEKVPEWATLKEQEVSRMPFWWGGKGRGTFIWRTMGIRSFLGITEPLFKTFKTSKTEEKPFEEQYFGLWDKHNGSLVISKDDCLISYGNPGAQARLLQDLENWVRIGMPTASSLELQVFPIDTSLTVGENQWLVKRTESQFLWSFK